MKILITYFSTTGNTKKVAKAIKEGIKEHDVDLISLNELDLLSLKSYDLAFLGSGIFAFNVISIAFFIIFNRSHLSEIDTAFFGL